ncbi:MAG: M90 family metallopeptidase [Verrucomicrobiota bacterium]|nr:M90 family metallopeptidase [Verrucomicrobiota bacterium]
MDSSTTIIFILGTILVTCIVIWAINRSSKENKIFRDKIFNSPFPDEWVEILEKNFKLYTRLPDELRLRLNSYVNVFMAEKSFEACGGLDELTEEMCVTIAGQACLLLLNGRCGFYDTLTTVLIYPDMYSGKSSLNEDGTVGGGGTRLGESWGSGTVILSWVHTLRGPSITNDGKNVVLHEFAHQLDQRDGSADGAPLLGFTEEHKDWAKSFGAAYERHGKRYRRGKKLVIDAYGATNPAEFFAVATETFFEKPMKLQQRYPRVYEQLKSFYSMDPLSW